jgi:cyclopropane fatty-acyl-phospholipid synthase-like methyltransferase
MSYTTRTTCRICGNDQLTPLYNFGDQYISNFVDPGHAYDGEKCPIELVYCPECTLVQNPHTAPQELLYSGHYWYRSGVTATMRTALADVVRDAMSQVDLQPMDVVLDIGSNDGTLLGFYPDNLCRVGVEPAKNLASEPQEKVDVLINDFWSADAYTNAVTGKAKIITACGMFYDLEDPNQFIEDVSQVLHPEGVFVAQLMCLKNMINCNDIGNMAHEHLEFYTLHSLAVLLRRHNLMIYDVTTNAVNGESYRISIRHASYPAGRSPEAGARVVDAFVNEVDILKDFEDFITRMEANRDEVQDIINEANEDGKMVCVYGASTKGNFLLQWYGTDYDDVLYAAERSPEKWGKVTAGTDIKIYSEAIVRQQRPDYMLVLPYAFISEFIEREKDETWRKAGGKFIVPLPELRIL